MRLLEDGGLQIWERKNVRTRRFTEEKARRRLRRLSPPPKYHIKSSVIEEVINEVKFSSGGD